MKGKHTEHAKLLVPVFICAMFGEQWYRPFIKTLKKIILPMLIHGFILQKTRKWGCGLSFRIIAVLRWTWLHYRESGIIKAVEYGLMIKK